MTTTAQIPIPTQLNGRHRHTYEAIFRHPVAHNLEWHDVRSLLASLGDLTEGHNGSIEVSRNGQTLTMHAPKHKDLSTVEDVLAIRRFLEHTAEVAKPVAVAPGTHLLVVIDHHEAKVYRAEMRDAIPQQIVPYDPHGFGRHLRSDTPETDGKRKPERKSFYEAIAATLRGANKILLFGSGTGESSAMDELLAELKRNHADVAANIVDSVVVDTHHHSEGELLAKARELFTREV